MAHATRRSALQNMEKLSQNTRALQPLKVGDVVQVQNQVGCRPSKWDITGTVIDVGKYDQYTVRIDGSGRMTLRNRKFLKKIVPYSHTERCDKLPWQSEKSDIVIDPVKDDSSVTSPPHIQSEESETTEERLPEQPAETDDSRVETPASQESFEPRRSTRVRAEPERLNIRSFGGQSYEIDRIDSESLQVWNEVGDNERHPIQSSEHTLHQDVTGGGGGIFGNAQPKPNPMSSPSRSLTVEDSNELVKHSRKT